MHIIFVKKEHMLRREMVVETTCYSRPKGGKKKEEPATCAEHEEKLIYWIWKKQIVKNELNLRKQFPKYKMGAYTALHHKATD